MDEFDIIRQHFKPAAYSASVVVGVGDDGAILRPDADRDLVVVVDTLIDGVHFPANFAADDVAYRTVAVNVSDIAAMGGRPRWMTCALTLVDPADAWLRAFAQGLYAAGEEYGLELVGGDTTRGNEIVVSIQVTGDIGRGNAVTRSGAQPGDGIYVSGTPGDAAMGLRILQGAGDDASRSARDEYLVQRFTRPTARVALGQAIAASATAAIDLSDGLFGDLEKLLDASMVSATIELNDIPLSTQLRAALPALDAIELALSGGDDYELCFTAAPGVFADRQTLAGVAITRIGQVTERGATQGLSCTRAAAPFTYHSSGYRHFDA